jgi:uncharacterized protein DUF6527
MKVMKLRSISDGKGTVGYTFYCKGCEEMHRFLIQGRMVWQFNGDMDRPTFTPSLKYDWQDGVKLKCCHLNMTAGKIFYHNDSTHALKGQTIDCPDIPGEYRLT